MCVYVNIPKQQKHKEMKPATLVQIRKELETVSYNRLLDITMKMVRHKTENKEFISFVLFDEENVADFASDIRHEISEMMQEVQYKPSYIIKRTLRKVLRYISRYCGYVSDKEFEAEMLVYFCRLMKEKRLHRTPIKSINIIYYKQLEKIEKLLPKLTGEVKTDIENELAELTS